MNVRFMTFSIISFSLFTGICAPLYGMEPTYKQSKIDTIKMLYLMYLNMGKGFNGIRIGENSVMKSGDQCTWYNRVFTGGDSLSPKDIQGVKQYIGDAPFGWWVSSEQKNVASMLAQEGFESSQSEHAMIRDLTIDLPSIDDEQVEMKKTLKDSKFIASWVKTSAQGFGFAPAIQQGFLNYIMGKADANDCNFYIGFKDNAPVSTCLMIEHTCNQDGKEIKIASLHLVSTIPSCRNQGGATLVSSAAMSDAKNDGCTHMILLSSPMAHPLYQDLGFEDYATYQVYTQQTNKIEIEIEVIEETILDNAQEDDYHVVENGDSDEEIISQEDHDNLVGDENSELNKESKSENFVTQEPNDSSSQSSCTIL